MTLLEQLRWRIKAVLAAAGVALVGVATWAVNDPATAAAIQQVIPAQFAPLVPVFLGAIAVALVNRVPNKIPEGQAQVDTVVVEPPTWTTVVTTANRDTGEFNGDPAH